MTYRTRSASFKRQATVFKSDQEPPKKKGPVARIQSVERVPEEESKTTEFETTMEQHQKEFLEYKKKKEEEIERLVFEVEKLKQRIKSNAELVREIDRCRLAETARQVSHYQDRFMDERNRVLLLEAKVDELRQKHVETEMAIPLNEQRVLSTLTCPVCLTYYTKEREPCVGSCGHSVCGYCFDILPTRTCPSCRAADSFRTRNKNFLAASIIEAYTERK